MNNTGSAWNSGSKRTPKKTGEKQDGGGNSFCGVLEKSSKRKIIKHSFFFVPTNKSVWNATVMCLDGFCQGFKFPDPWVRSLGVMDKGVFNMELGSTAGTDAGFQTNEDNKSCSQKTRGAGDLSNNSQVL